MDAPEVQLNEGQLWEANMATIEGIKKLRLIVNSFDSSSENYETLPSNLRDEFGLIFKNCAMKGEAHEQLLASADGTVWRAHRRW